MYRDLTKGSIAKGLIWFALTGPVGEVGIRIAIPTGFQNSYICVGTPLRILS